MARRCYSLAETGLAAAQALAASLLASCLLKVGVPEPREARADRAERRAHPAAERLSRRLELARTVGRQRARLRCGALEGATALLHSGAGIVIGSDPEAEWNETQQKLEPMLRALVRP